MLCLHACIDNIGASDHIKRCHVVYNALQAISAPAVQGLQVMSLHGNCHTVLLSNTLCSGAWALWM